MPTQVLLTTTCPLTAGFCGMDGPSDHRETGEGFEVRGSIDKGVGPIITFMGPDGEVALYGATAIRMVAKELLEFAATADRASARNAEIALCSLVTA